MPTYFRFGFGPFRVSQRLGRTQAQKRAAAKSRAQRQSARERAREQADRDRRSFNKVPAHDVVHGEGGYTSFILDPPGFPQLVIKLENGHFSTENSLLNEDLTWLREGDRVSGMLGRDGRSLAWLSGSLEDRMRYTYAGWAEDITRQPDGSTRFRIVFPANPEHLWHPEGREPLEVTLPPGEKVRWKDGRPYRMREGSSLTVIIDPDGGPPTFYHQTYG